MKIRSAIFTVLILLMLAAPSVGMAVFGPAPSGANEILANAPKSTTASGTPNLAYLDGLRDYVDDRFWLRQELITAGRQLSAALFGATGSKDVVLGRDGWLFYASTLPDFTGSAPMTDRELWSAARNLYLIYESCRDRGTDFLFTAAPNKNSLYGEYMPNPDIAAPERDVHRLYRLLEAMGVPHLDLEAVLGARDEVLYLAHDSHWSSRGAALAADALTAALGRETSWFSGTFAPAPHTGDLYEMLYPAAEDPENDQVPSPEIPFEYGPGGRRPDSITITTVGGGEGSLFMYRDSFGNSLYPYMAASFGQALFSRSSAYDMAAVADRDPDVLVIELVERNLQSLIDEPPSLPAPRRDLELPAPSGAVTIYTGEQSSGCIRIFGALPARPDTDSPVYISNSAGVFEAALTRDGFTALVPLADAPWAAAFYIDGQLTSFEGQ